MSTQDNSALSIGREQIQQSEEIGDLITRVLSEDIGSGDVTTAPVLPKTIAAQGAFLAKQELMVCGIPLLERFYREVDLDIIFRPRVRDGARVGPALLAVVEGDAQTLLQVERTALNFFQRMCGIATLTDRFTDELTGTKARLRDTRKTTPGLRLLEKYAVAVGGGVNHRMGLYDAVLIKENHSDLAGGAGEAVRRARAAHGDSLHIQVEVRNDAELREALAAAPDSVLLDNMTPEQAAACVAIVAGSVPVEVSGGITLENARAYAETGADFLAVGALTHSAPAADISFDLAPKKRA